MTPPSQDVIALTYWWGVETVEDWVIAKIESQVHHATITPASHHVSIERWAFVNGTLSRAAGIENVPLFGRRYDPFQHLTKTRRYVLDDLEPERVRLVWHNAQRLMLGRLYDFPGLLTAGIYAITRRPDRIWQSRHTSCFCQEGVCLTLRASNVPMLEEFRVGSPPMIVSPDSTTPSESETWTAHLYPDMPTWAARYGMEMPA